MFSILTNFGLGKRVWVNIGTINGLVRHCAKPSPLQWCWKLLFSGQLHIYPGLMYPSYRINDLITSYHIPSPYLTSYIWSYFTISYPMAIVSNLTNSTLSSFMISSIIMIISFHFISHFMSSLYLYHLSSLPISSHLTVSLIWYIISHLIVNPIHHINSPNCSSLI